MKNYSCCLGTARRAKSCPNMPRLTRSEFGWSRGIRSNSDWKINWILRKIVSFYCVLSKLSNDWLKCAHVQSILGFFDHQYFWKEAIKFFDFFLKDTCQREVASNSSTVVGCGQVCPVTTRLGKDLPVDFGWSGGCIATLKIVQNERLTKF